MKQTMLWMLGLCMGLLFPAGHVQAMENTMPAVNAAESTETTETTESIEPAVCDTLCMTWTAEAGVEKWFSFSGTEGGTFRVDWGDGTDTVVIGKMYILLRHSYAETGSYAVTVMAIVQDVRITRFNCNGSSELNNGVTSLDVSGNPALTYLSCSYNQLSTLDVTKNPALITLHCYCNQLSLLDVSQIPNLWDLRCENNQLSLLDVSKNTTLDRLHCFANQLSLLDVSQNTVLRDLNCCHNQLSILDVHQNTALTSLSCYRNQLSSLDVSQNTALKYLDCDENQLTVLDVSQNTTLNNLHCSNNQLSTLDVSQNPSLGLLFCFKNQLTSLDVSANTALTSLSCHHNQLTSLDVSANTALTQLWCTNNQLTVDLDADNGFDLSTLPGLDISRIGNIAGGRLEGSRLIFEAERVTYQYATHFPGEASRGFDSVAFKLVASAPLMPVEPDEPTDPTEPAVCDTIFMTWTAEVGEEKPLSIVVEEPESWNGSRTFWVNFGDGSYLYSSAVDTAFTKTYTEAGRYNVTIAVDRPEMRITGFDCSGTWDDGGTLEKNNGVISLDVSKNTALTALDCGHNQLTVLNVSANTALTHLSCFYNRLTALDVSQNTALRLLECSVNQLYVLELNANKTMMTLYCEDNQLASLDVSLNTALKSLGCGHNQLTSLDVSANKALSWLSCGNNKLTSLDVSANTVLKTLVCHNNQLTALDVSANTALEFFHCSDNQLTALDVSQNTALTELYCFDNRLTWLDLSANAALIHLGCGYNRLAVDLDADNGFDLSTLPGLDISRIGSVTGGRLEGSRLIFEEERVTYHYATHFPGESSLGFDSVEFTLVASAPLTPTEPEEPTDPTDAVCDTIFMTWTAEAGEENAFRFSGTEHCAFYVNWGDGNDTMVIGTEIWTNDDLCYGQKLRHSYAEAGSYDVMLAAPAANTSIKTFGCGGNNVTVLDVSRSTALTELSCGFNQLAVLDVSANTALLALYCDDNLLTSLDVGQNTALTVLSCFNNQLTSLDVRANMALEFLDCRINQLTALDVSQNTALGYVGCSDNQLTALDVSNNMVLTALDCYVNQLTSLEVSANTALKYLLCGNNQLTDLDVSQNTALMELSCGFNQLTTLDVSKNTALTKLACHYNQLTSLKLNRNIALTELECYNNQLTMLDLNKNTALVELWCDDNLLSSLDLSRCPNLEALGCYGNTRTVLISTDRTFDMTLLPGMDVSRIGSMTGGRLENSQLIFETEWVTYRYATHFSGDASRGFDSVEFTLIASESITPPTDPTLPSDTLAPEHGAGWIWMASAGEEKEMTFKGTGKGFRVDWGDGSTDEAKGGVAMVSGADGAAMVSVTAPAPKDSEKELKHRYAKEGIYTVQLIPLSQNGRLTDLEVSEERVLALAFGDASMLETLDCSDNLLTELALPEAAKLKDLDCSDNLLAALDLSGCAALQEVDFSDNRLTSLALPTHASLKDVEGEDNRLRLSSLYELLSGRVKNASYGFDPQSDSVTVTENAVFDLVSEMTIAGRATTYTLLDAATRRPAPASDYAAEGGMFRFSKPGARYVLTLKNANVTDYEKGRADEVVAFTYYIYVSGVGNEDLASDEAASAPWAYVVGRTIYLTSDGLGEVEAFTAVGRRVYRGYDRAFSVPTAGVYVLRAADGRRCKVLVR